MRFVTSVLTHANGDHTHGGQLLPGSASIIAAEGTAHEMRPELAPELTAALQVMDLGPMLTPYLPGHGPVTDAAGIRAVRDYFRHVVEQADAAHAEGLDFQEAAFGVDLAEYAGWLDAERVVVNIYRRYREIRPDRPELDRFTLFGLMAEWDSRRQSPDHGPRAARSLN
ncbi:hypothetical protein [Streptomyces sp. NPDC058773]|uniref:hypothetical protein n=1 Tax=Streptomyces sp. NPDC058773 TaxID=3346632 RepID=UPI0036C6A962